ncbi:MAG: hypothetical protein JW840_01420 [Candidatus Thermoplasmatota archaeon]|nr:hypothetical protein [Candidatus Thermoplasmatota archaeon]
MSAEKIIERIKTDAEKQVKHVIDEAEKQSRLRIKTAKQEAEKQADAILRDGQAESDNAKKILVSKALQDMKRDMMNAKEEIIEQCFSQALKTLAALPEDQYKKFIKNLIQTGKKRLGEHCVLSVSRPIDNEIAKQEKVPVQGSVTSIGGVILRSSDGTITIDNTFERLLSRKKNEIRIHVGKLLFPA